MPHLPISTEARSFRNEIDTLVHPCKLNSRSDIIMIGLFLDHRESSKVQSISLRINAITISNRRIYDKQLRNHYREFVD